MNQLGGSKRLAISMLGLCGLVFATAGCDGSSSDDGATTNDETTQSSTDGPGSGTETDPSDTDPGDETAGDSEDTGPPPEGLGCDVQPVCDKGTYEGTVTLSTEADMAEIEGYTGMTGFLLVRNSDYTCLDFLACLQTARGVSIENNEYLGTLDGLGALEEVLYNVTVSQNAVLTDVGGMTSLAKVFSDGDDLQLGQRGVLIYDNDSLEDVSGFDALRELEGDITITNNPNLLEVSGFNGVDTILDHPNANKEPGQPVRAGGSIVISRNPKLERISGFTDLIVIYRNLTIQYNDLLTRLTGLYDLLALGGAFVVTNNAELCNSEAFKVGGDLEQGPGPGSSTANNKDC